jgi:hypothetical protein
MVLMNDLGNEEPATLLTQQEADNHRAIILAALTLPGSGAMDIYRSGS